MQDLGDTETVLAAYESHVRLKSDSISASNPSANGGDLGLERAEPKPEGDVDCPPFAQSFKALTGKKRGVLVSVNIENLTEANVPRLSTPDLVVVLTARMADHECPSFGVMIEQVNGVGITSAGNHADGIPPRSLGDGLWQSRITFEALPLHTGEYTVSVYLFGWDGLVVYEEWPRCKTFLHVNPLSTPGLVRLPHYWS